MSMQQHSTPSIEPQQNRDQDEVMAAVRQLPELHKLDDPVWREIIRSARLVTIPAGTVVFREGNECANYLIVVKGAVRVQKIAESGREITLYRVYRGQTCVITTACLFAGEDYPAQGITESEVVAIAIPIKRFLEGVDQSVRFREFVFSTYGQRIADLILLIEEVACRRIDVRLAQWLLSSAGTGTVVESTHQQIANELVTAREVISRQLKELEGRKWVRLGRGRIEITDTEGLQSIARKGLG